MPCGWKFGTLAFGRTWGDEGAFIDELTVELLSVGVDPSDIRVTFSEDYAGHCISADHPMCRIAQDVARQFVDWEGWSGFNSGCEAGVRANVHGTPTLVWGPGTLDRAHAINERLELSEMERSARMFAAFAELWCNR